MQPIVLAIKGGDKSGKTSLALSAPTPIFFAELDVGGYDRAIHRFPHLEKQGLIARKSYFIPQQSIRERMGLGPNGEPQKARAGLRQAARLTGVKETWYRFLTDYVDVLDNEARAPNGEPFTSVVVDSAPMLWDLLCSGYLQEKQERQRPDEKLREQLIQIEYSEPNARFRAVIYGARESRKNLILTHQLTDEREDRLVDGKVQSVVVGQRSAGWKHIGKECDLEVQVAARWTNTQNNGSVTRKLLPVGKVTLSGLSLDLVDQELVAPSWDMLAQMVEVYRAS